MISGIPNVNKENVMEHATQVKYETLIFSETEIERELPVNLILESILPKPFSTLPVMALTLFYEYRMTKPSMASTSPH